MTRTLLLEPEVAVVLDLVDRELSYNAWRGYIDYTPAPIPDGARRLTLTTRAGEEREVFVRPAVLDALHEAHAAAIDIVWHTTWLAAPDTRESLAALAQDLGLTDVVRFPAADEIVGTPTFRILHPSHPEFWEDWRLRTILERVRGLQPGDELVTAAPEYDLSVRWIAAGIARRTGVVDPAIGSIPVRREWGLDDARLRTWDPERPASSAENRSATTTWHRDA